MLFNINNFRYFSDTYLETGSCMGESIRRAKEAGFLRIKSVELFEPFYNHCQKHYPDVDLYLGKSSDKLPEMLKDIDKPIVIFLDAHPAGPNTGGHDELKQGNQEYKQDNILRTELSIILNHRPDHLIIIDDQVPGEECEDYMDFMKKSNPSYTFEFFDEQLLPTEPYFKDKILVCFP